MMWQRMLLLSLLVFGLCACLQKKPPLEAQSSVSLCEILKQKIEVNSIQADDPATMKRKNAGDQALLLQEYNSYDCPEIVDSAPPP
jgi:hypothetical protein